MASALSNRQNCTRARKTLHTRRGRTHGAGCVRQWFRTAEPLGERRYENWNTHTFTSPKSIIRIAIRGGLRDVTADSELKCHITPALTDYSPCSRFSIVWNDYNYIYTLELQWLEHLWNHENMFETGLVRAKGR